MDEVLEAPLPPELDEVTDDAERSELLAEELREAIRRKLPPVEAPA
jgi:hypothetical protein